MYIMNLLSPIRHVRMMMMYFPALFSREFEPIRLLFKEATCGMMRKYVAGRPHLC